MAAPPPRSTTPSSPPCAAQRIGFVFQFFQLLPTLTVLENVELPLLLAGARDPAAHRARTPRWVGLKSQRRVPPEPALRRPAAARCHRARTRPPARSILIADEPTGNLDTSSGDTVLQLIRQSAKEFGATVVMATHSAEAAAIADTRVRLRDGRIEASKARGHQRVKLLPPLILRPLRRISCAPRSPSFRRARSRSRDRHRPRGRRRGGSFQSSLQTLVGKVDLQIIANGGIDEAMIGKLAALPINATFCPILEAPAIYGVDPFLCAAALKLSTGRTNNDGVKIIDIAEAQKTLNRYGSLDQIAIFVDPRQNFDAAERQIRAALPPGYELERPGARSEENQRMLRAFRWNLRVLSYISLVVGAFLIYNTISVSVVRRRAEIGILRALGAAPSPISGCSWAKRCSWDSRAPRSASCSDACWRQAPWA